MPGTSASPTQGLHLAEAAPELGPPAELLWPTWWRPRTWHPWWDWAQDRARRTCRWTSGARPDRRDDHPHGRCSTKSTLQFFSTCALAPNCPPLWGPPPARSLAGGEASTELGRVPPARSEASTGGVHRRPPRGAAREETGLYYHGARYYAAWLGRWTAVDPAGVVDGLNVYAHSRGSPLRYSDPSGTQSDDDTGELEAETDLYERQLNPEEDYLLTPEQLEQVQAERSASEQRIDELGGSVPPAPGEASVEPPPLHVEENPMFFDVPPEPPPPSMVERAGQVGQGVRTFFEWFPPTALSTRLGGAIGEGIIQDVETLAAGPEEKQFPGASGPVTFTVKPDPADKVAAAANLALLAVPFVPKAAGGARAAAQQALRPDVVLSGGRSGQLVKGLVGPPSSVVRGGGARAFVTNDQGQVILDITAQRVKPVIPGQGFVTGVKRAPTAEELDLLNRVLGGG